MMNLESCGCVLFNEHRSICLKRRRKTTKNCQDGRLMTRNDHTRENIIATCHFYNLILDFELFYLGLINYSNYYCQIHHKKLTRHLVV